MTPEIRTAEIELERARQRYRTAQDMHAEGLLRQLGGEPLDVLGPASRDFRVALDRVSSLRYRNRCERRWALRGAGYSAAQVTEMLTAELRAEMKGGAR